jgi:DNA-binding CsgD family transcriptional regulator
MAESARHRGARAREASGIYELQMREAISKARAEGVPLAEIARQLGQSVSTVRRYLKQSQERALEIRLAPPETDPSFDPNYGRQTPPSPPPRKDHTRNRRGRGPGPHVKGSPKLPTEILDPPEAVEYRQTILYRRKQAKTYEQIAQELHLPVSDVKRYLAQALRSLEDSELASADLERRLMVEQIDDMIRSVWPHAVTDEVDPVSGMLAEPNLAGIDKLSKLLAQKAKLLGLDVTPTVDIMLRLQQIAADSEYDIEDVEEIARDVFSRHKLPMPPARRPTGPASPLGPTGPR